MSDSPPPMPVAGDVIGRRYRVIRKLGSGGMAVVVEVEDLSTGQRLALKRLRVAESAKPVQAELFELEYHTLSQLRHPAIVRAHEFGRDQFGPFYTMELLDGGELRTLAPLPWRKTCELLIDICSALSLLHSRRLVHRDVTVRNIHCNREGEARLIDFGAMTVAGASTDVVGTPPFCAPEIFGLQVVDARTDIYSLGAAAYFTLTGKHAYGARSFPALHRAWRTPPQSPSSLVPDIPPQLDQLVMSMLNLQAVARPGSAVEVMQRLASIANRKLEGTQHLSHAHLTTPTLVGRKTELGLVRKRITRALNGRGAAVLVNSRQGFGQTRFIDACVLEAKLAGATALRIGRIGEGGSWGGTRSMLKQLRVALGDTWNSLGHNATELERLLPGLSEDDGPGTRSAHPIPPSDRPQIMTCAQALLSGTTSTQTLVVAIDDLHALDEPSAALVAWLARESEGKRMLVIAGLDPKATTDAEDAINVVKRVAVSVRLVALSGSQTRELLGSVFGEVPHLDLLAASLHRATGGMPRSIMRLAQHLVDVGKIAFSDGAFVLPVRLDHTDLPVDERASIQLRAANLSQRARHLGEAIALYPADSLTLATTVRIAEPDQARSDHLQALDELLSAGLLAARGRMYSLLDRDIRAALLETLEPAREREHCLRIAYHYAQTDAGYPLEVHFLMRAGQLDQALERLLSQLPDIGAPTEVGAELASRLESLPEDWQSVCSALLTHCEQTGRSKRDAYRIRAHLVATGNLQDAPVGDEIIALLTQLARDAGLDIYGQLDAGLDPTERLSQALQLAEERYAQTPEIERVLPPRQAVPVLARTLSIAIAYFASAYDRSLLASLPNITPLASLAPALNLVRQNHLSSMDYRVERLERAHAGFLAMADRLEQPDRCGLDPHAQTYIRLSILFAAAMIDVTMERSTCLELAERIEHDPLFKLHATRIRMLHAVTHGDSKAGARYEREVELLVVHHSPTRMFGGTDLWLDLQARVACDELLRVQELLPKVRRMVDRFPSWQPILHFAIASYQRIRGDHQAALSEIEQALPLVRAGEHGAWPKIAASHVTLLLLTGQPAAARDAAKTALAAARDAELPFATLALERGLAAAHAKLGEYERAIEHADAVIARRKELSTGGVSLGLAHETRARIAIEMGRQDDFIEHAQACAVHYCEGGSPALSGKYERLVHDARTSGLRAGSVPPTTADEELESLGPDLSQCSGSEERMRRALEIILRRSGSPAGFLYLHTTAGPRLVAHSQDCVPSTGADTFARRMLETELSLRDDGMSTLSVDNPALEGTRWREPDGTAFVGYVLEHNHESSPLVTGVVLLEHPDDLDLTGLATILPALSEALHLSGEVSVA